MRSRLAVSALMVVAFAASMFARAQPTVPTQAVKLADLQLTETKINTQLNALIRSGKAASETTVVHTKCFKDVVDTTVYKHKDASTLVKLKPEELQFVRDALSRKIDSIAIAKGQLDPKFELIGKSDATSVFSGKLMIRQ